MQDQHINYEGGAIDLNGKGLLITGPSGVGKSSLSLRLIDEKGAKLVSDDRTIIARDGESLIASAPPTIAKMMEIFGHGIIKLSNQQIEKQTRLYAIIELSKGPPESLPRIRPEGALGCDTLLGISLPKFILYGHDAALPSKINFILQTLHSKLIL